MSAAEKGNQAVSQYGPSVACPVASQYPVPYDVAGIRLLCSALLASVRTSEPWKLDVLGTLYHYRDNRRPGIISGATAT